MEVTLYLLCIRTEEENMIINFVTTNPFKLEAAKLHLEPALQIEGIKLDLIEPQSNDQEYVAKHKIEQAFNLVKKPVMVEDLGVYIEKYNQFPGILTKFILSGIGIEGIEKLIEEGEPAYYKSTIIYKDEKCEFLVSHKMKGVLTKKLKSSNFNPNTPFKSIFIPAGCDMPMADLPDEMKNKLSFDHNFFSKFKKELLLNKKSD
jgi:non-canonical purine NTP pyrophosphatase (RdgB/HAM1 family)